MKTPQRSKDHLVEVAMKLFAEKGYGTVTETHLLETAKVSKGILVYHFHDKTGILKEILRQYIPFFLKIIPPEAASSPPEENLIYVINSWCRYLEEHRIFWNLYFPLTFNPNYQAHIYSTTLEEFYHTHYQLLLQCFEKNNPTLATKEAQAFEIFRKGLTSTFLASPDSNISTLKKLWLEKFRLHSPTSDPKG